MSKAEEILNKHLSDLDVRSYIKGSGLAYKACIGAINEALNIHIVSKEKRTVCEDWDNYIECVHWGIFEKGCDDCLFNPHK